MADIIAKVVDQAVIIENTPVIASGGVNEDRVVFDFSANWNGYIKTCVFYRAETHIGIPVLMTDDTATIPAEIIAQPGKFLFGVVGTKSGIRYTSEMVMFRVNVGAKTELIPAPTADVYEQILDLISGTITPTQIREIHKHGILKFWVGTQAEYNATVVQNGVFYIIYDVDPIADLDARVTALGTRVTSAEEDIRVLSGKMSIRTVGAWRIVTVNGEIDLFYSGRLNNVVTAHHGEIWRTDAMRTINLPANAIDEVAFSAVTLSGFCWAVGNATNTTSVGFYIASGDEISSADPQPVDVYIHVHGTKNA